MYSEANTRTEWIRRAVGIALIVAGLGGLWYCVRVARHQITYQRIKFREPDVSLTEAAQTAEAIHRLYPHNYHMSRWLAEKAWYEHGDRELALHWVGRGLEQNPHHLEMRWLETALIGMEDPVEAARVWEAYSDKVFWNRFVLAGRVYWLAYAGRVEEAEHYLAILRKTPGNHAWAAEAVEAVRGTERR